MTPEIRLNTNFADLRVVPLELFPFNHAKENLCDKALRTAAESIIEVAITHGFNPALRGNVLTTHVAPSMRQLIEDTRAAVHAGRTVVALGPYPVLPYEPPTPSIGACDIVIDGDEHDLEALAHNAKKALAVGGRGAIYEEDVPVQRRYQGNHQYVALHERLKPKTRVSLSLASAPEHPQLPLLTLRQTTQRIGMPVSSASLSTVGMMAEYTTDSVYLAPRHHSLQRRRSDRTTNLDALAAPIEQDSSGRLAIRIPQIPDAVRFSDEAIVHYQEALARGDGEAAWAGIEAVLRSIRYSCLLNVPWADETIGASCSLMQSAASIVRSAPFAMSEAAAQKLSDELLTACMYNHRAAVDLIGQTGAHIILAPPVSEAWNDLIRRENISSEIAASLKAARRSNWPAGAMPSVIKGAIKRIVYGTTQGTFQPDPLIIVV